MIADLDGKPRRVDGNCDGNAVVDPGVMKSPGTTTSTPAAW